MLVTFYLLLSCLPFFNVFAANNNSINSQAVSNGLTKTKLAELESLRMNAEEYERVDNLHKTWFLNAVQALLGALGREMYLKMRKPNKQQFIKCLDAIEEDVNLPASARCIINAKINFPIKSRHKRSSMSTVAESESKIKNMDKPPKLISPDKLAPKSSAKTLINVLTNSVRAWRGREKEQGSSAYVQLQQLNTVMKSFRETQNYHRRMLDIVVGGDKSYRKPTHLSERLSGILPSPDKVPLLLRNLYSQLVEKLGNQTGSQLNYQFLSPRFAAIVESRAGSAGQSTNNQALSPNLFPLYQADQDDQGSVKDKDILPVSDLLDKAGIPIQNKGAMLELIMEASGASQLVSDSLKIIRQQSSQVLMDDIEGVTGLVATKFQDLKKKLNAKQSMELEKRKYTFMDDDQLHFMYSDRDLFPSLPPRLTDMFGNRSELDRKKLLDTLINSLAHRPKRDTKKKDENEVEEEKQQGGVFLSPFAFSPTIAQLTVLGPIILSPSIFSPAILGPAVLSPPILSPQVGNPLILSPYVLGPNILSAAVFNPYVLSPYVLSPNILNPYVLSPLILSPHVLSPDILSPVVLSGTILNPHVMSPAILSDSIIGVDILSPSVLS